MMITKEEVQKFLNQFHEKMKIFGIIYRDDRGKNQKTLEELEIVPSYRRVVIENLVVEDYVQGPVVDELNKLGEMWVFGKDVKGREVYIKIMTYSSFCRIKHSSKSCYSGILCDSNVSGHKLTVENVQ